ncbi:MAG: molybdate ABC transporter substrate-binding protein [Clostridiales Family XIII bacterium]|nr:molybdate ABC transporter substrate-binding protein [Clostridiales Family XIII bacterium]
MKNLKCLALVLAIVLVAAAFAGCGSSKGGDSAGASGGSSAGDSAGASDTGSPAVSDLSGNIMIAAAASLQNAFDEELIPLFNESYPGITVTGTYDSSGKLQTQIEEGLEAALFFSAATKQMDALTAGNLIDAASVVNLLENEVVLITGTGTDTKVTSFENITDAASIAVGDPASVPAGQYAQEVLTSLGSWDAVNARASLGTNVTEVLNWVAEGSAEVGVVYATDAASMPDKVKVIAIAPAGSLQTPVVYPVGLHTDLGDRQEAAQALIDFLKSGEALAVFEKYGFKAA